MAAPAQVPAAVARRRKSIEGANLADAAVTLTVVPPSEPAPVLAVTPAVTPTATPESQPFEPLVTIAPVPEDDAFLREFMGDAVALAPVEVPVAAPAPVAPLALAAPLAPVAPLALEPSPAPVATFESLFALDVPGGSAPTLAPTPVATPAVPAVPADSATAQELASLREEVARLSAAAVAPAAAPAPVLTPESYTLTSEQRDAYQDSIPVIETVARGMVQALVAPLMARLEAAESAVSQVPEFDSRLTAIRGQAYQTQLYGSVPDIDELVTLPLFTQFVSQTIPYSGETVRSRLGAAHRSHDLKAVSAIMNDFRRFAGDSGPAPTAASLTVPVPSAAPAAGSSHEVPTAQPKVLPWSRMKEATRLKNAGRMKPEEFEKVRTLFQKAEAEQRIDYNT